MTNPVIVFVVPTELNLNQQDFPIGFTNEGEKIVGAVGQERSYCVLLLDDTADLPEQYPIAQSGDGPLLIVKHKGSLLHQDLQNEVKKKWEMDSLVCEDFSHVSTDNVLHEIQGFVANPSKAEVFAECYRTADHLAVLDELAGICQLRMLDNTDETKKAVRELVEGYQNRIPPDFRSKFMGKYDDGDVQACFALINDEVGKKFADA